MVIRIQKRAKRVTPFMAAYQNVEPTHDSKHAGNKKRNKKRKKK